MARNAIRAPYRSRVLPRLIGLLVLTLALLIAVRHPADTGDWVRAVATSVVAAADMMSEFVRADGR